MQPKSAGGTKRDLIAEDIRRLIVAGEFRSGDRLPQDALAERFGVSITPVREALRVLEAGGLVVSEPHRGVRVLAVDADRVSEIYILRRLAEPYAMRRAAVRVSQLEVRAAEDISREIEIAAAAGETSEVRRLNYDFHFYFYERCGLRALTEHIASLWAAFPWDLLLGSEARADHSEREHRDIIDALRSGNVDEVERATERHIRQGFAAVSTLLGTEFTSDPFEDGGS